MPVDGFDWSCGRSRHSVFSPDLLVDGRHTTAALADDRCELSGGGGPHCNKQDSFRPTRNSRTVSFFAIPGRLTRQRAGHDTGRYRFWSMGGKPMAVRLVVTFNAASGRRAPNSRR